MIVRLIFKGIWRKWSKGKEGQEEDIRLDNLGMAVIKVVICDLGGSKPATCRSVKASIMTFWHSWHVEESFDSDIQIATVMSNSTSDHAGSFHDLGNIHLVESSFQVD